MKLPSLTAIFIALSLLASLANGRAGDFTAGAAASPSTTPATPAKATPAVGAAAPAPATPAAPPHIVGFPAGAVSAPASTPAPPPHIVGTIPAPATASGTPETTAHDDAKAQAKRDQEEATRIARQQLREAEDMADATMAREAAAGSNSSNPAESDAPTPEQIQAQTIVHHYTMDNLVSESHTLNPPPDTTHHSMYNFF